MDPNPAKANREGLQLIRKSLQLSQPDSTPKDENPKNIVLVAIDFENSNAIRPGGKIFDTGIEIGLATLDIQDLELGILTYNFAAGSSKFGAAASRRFLFGKSTTITIEHLLQSIEETMPREKNVILTGFELYEELTTLRRLGFDLKSSNIYGIIDTRWIAQEVFPSFTGSLEDLLCRLKCPYGQLHCAGNDAHFTLRALLLLATWNIMPPSERILTLQGIAYNPIEEGSGIIVVPTGNEEPSRALRKRRTDKATRRRKNALTLEETQRCQAANAQRQQDRALRKDKLSRKAQRKRNVSPSTRERIRVEKEQRRENSIDLDLSCLDLLT